MNCATQKCGGSTRIPAGGYHKLILENYQSPGDILMLTAAVRDLHRAYPGRFLTDVRTSTPALWENNPYITPIGDKEGRRIQAGYSDAINQSNGGAHHFVHGFTQDLEKKLGIRIPVTELAGDVHISGEEAGWISQVGETGYTGEYWVLASGGKYDFTAKWWNPDSFQAVVDHFDGKIKFVQVGAKEHFHPKLRGVLDLTGKTDLRQFVRLIYNSVGVLCPVTFAMHAAAATPVRPGYPSRRACVVVAGGREPAQWEAYPDHRYLSTQGALKCCIGGGCWKSRATLVNDGDEKNTKDVCVDPIPIYPLTPYPSDRISGDLKVGHCMHMITPGHVIEAIESYYRGGLLSYEKRS